MAVQRKPAAQRKARKPGSPSVWTYEDYLHIPDDGYRYEVVWGELTVPPSPTFGHQRVLGILFSTLHQHVTAHDLGVVCVAPLDVVLSEQNVLQPDILFVTKERLHIVTEANVNGAPDLVIEVLSPGTAAVDRGRRMDAFAAFGVLHCWLIDPLSHSLEVYELRGERYEMVSRLTETDAFAPAIFPGLSLPLASVW